MPRIESRDNPTVKLVRSLQSDKGRREAGLFLAEGPKLALAGLAAGWQPAILFLGPGFEPDDQLQSALQAVPESRIYQVSERVLKAASSTETPQPVLSAFSIPQVPPPAPTGQIVCVLDHLQDPGNVGAILRTALASGLCEMVVHIGGADPYGPKVVRAAAGAHFYLNLIQFSEMDDFATWWGERKLWLTDSAGQTPCFEADWRQCDGIVFGSEGAGVSQQLRRLCQQTVAVPIDNRVESLNVAVAAAIVLFEAARQVNSQKG